MISLKLKSRGTKLIDCPAFSFLIDHPSGRKLLFDLGVRIDFHNLPPIIQSYFQEKSARITVEKDVYSILTENGVDRKGIEAIVWSHWHWNHVGDPYTFPASTSLIVGPGLTKTEPIMPGYPKNPGSPLLETEFEWRELIELEFGASAIKVGDFDALDYFGDGSFYILDAPGHTVGQRPGPQPRPPPSF
jgi:glyoxylase-like metal-dependent hydrolase (beta-lactamase superfamily II)